MLRGHETELSSRASTTQVVPSPVAPQASPVSQPKLLERMHQALSALLFLYRHVIGRQVGDLGQVIRARKRERLRVQDIDFSRNEIVVRDGKGAKDRITMLPASVENPLQEHLRRVQPMTCEKRALMPIRITPWAIWPKQILPFGIERSVTPGEGYPQASYTARHKERRILCGYI